MSFYDNNLTCYIIIIVKYAFYFIVKESTLD